MPSADYCVWQPGILRELGALCLWMKLTGYVPICSARRFNRRLYRFAPLETLACGCWATNRHEEDRYVIDSFSVPVCRNCSISRCRGIPDVESRVYRQHEEPLLGLKVQMKITTTGVREGLLHPRQLAGQPRDLTTSYDLPLAALCIRRRHRFGILVQRHVGCNLGYTTFFTFRKKNCSCRFPKPQFSFPRCVQ